MIEFNAKNPGKEMIAVAMIYDQAPFAIVSLKKHGIAKPADLKGKKGASPSFDSTYRLFNVFAKVNGLDPASMTWANVAPQLREPMLARGETEAIAGFSFTSRLSLRGLGVADGDITTLMLRDHGLDMYSNAVIVSPGRIDRSPCGTGTSARLAVMHARGQIKVGEEFIHESIIDTKFTGIVRATAKVGDVPSIDSTVTGRAWITGFHQYVIDPSDPLPTGYRLSDTWPLDRMKAAGAFTVG